ncbi:hypothetical protein Drorol1_Dr00000252 [Drosera rotundifolia]
MDLAKKETLMSNGSGAQHLRHRASPPIETRDGVGVGLTTADSGGCSRRWRRFAPDFSTARVLVLLSSPQRRAFSPFKSLLSLSSSSSLLALLLPPPPLASAAIPIAVVSKRTQEDDEQWLGFLGFSISRVWISRLALLLSGLEDNEQWLGLPGPPSSRCSSGFSPPPDGCLISSRVASISEQQSNGKGQEKMIHLHGLHANEAVHVLKHEKTSDGSIVSLFGSHQELVVL